MWQNLVECGNAAEFGRMRQCGRSWQNLAMVKFGRMRQCGRIWQNLAMWQNLVECGNVAGNMP